MCITISPKGTNFSLFESLPTHKVDDQTHNVLLYSILSFNKPIQKKLYIFGPYTMPIVGQRGYCVLFCMYILQQGQEQIDLWHLFELI